MPELVFIGSWVVGSFALVGLLFIWLLPAILFACIVQGTLKLIFGRRDKNEINR